MTGELMGVCSSVGARLIPAMPLSMMLSKHLNPDLDDKKELLSVQREESIFMEIALYFPILLGKRTFIGEGIRDNQIPHSI
jgi:hypothetical protein